MRVWMPLTALSLPVERLWMLLTALSLPVERP